MTLLRIVRALDGNREDFIELWKMDNPAPAATGHIGRPFGKQQLPSERELLAAQLEELKAIRALLAHSARRP